MQNPVPRAMNKSLKERESRLKSSSVLVCPLDLFLCCKDDKDCVACLFSLAAKFEQLSGETTEL